MSSEPQAAAAIQLFYSYSHKDADLIEALREQLADLRRTVISDWYDRDIRAGMEWATEIDKRLEKADIILLLVSRSFMNSNYCFNIEAKRAMERHDAGEAIVIPVILRPVSWKRAAFSKLQALPTNARPVTKWKNRDDAFLSVVEAIEKAIEATGRVIIEADNTIRRLSSAHIPRPPSIGFVRREDKEQQRDLVERLKDELAPGKHQVIALWGAGGIANTLHSLGRLAHDEGELAEARRLYGQSLAIAKKLDNQRGIAYTQHSLGVLAQDQGEIDEARRLYEESLAIEKKLGNQSGIAISLHGLGRLAEDEGDVAEAVRLISKALVIYEKLKSPYAEMARRDLERLKGAAS